MKRVIPFTCVGAINIGVDIEAVSRFEKLDLAADKTFLNNIYTEKELRYCFSRKNKAQALAGRFSAKESVTKALNAFDVRAIRFPEIEVRNDKYGLPKVTLYGKGLSPYDVKVSISHSKASVLTAAIATIKYAGK